MKIGVVSDTHIPKRATHLPKALLKGLCKVDHIIHAGDWVTLDVYKELRKLAPVDGVAGNCDGKKIIKKFGKKKILTFQGFRIGVFHGEGKKKTTEKRAWEAFVKDHVDLIIFGHSHIPLIKNHEGVILFNPGSPTDKRRQTQFSYGILTLGKEIKVQHVYYDDKS